MKSFTALEGRARQQVAAFEADQSPSETRAACSAEQQRRGLLNILKSRSIGRQISRTRQLRSVDSRPNPVPPAGGTVAQTGTVDGADSGEPVVTRKMIAAGLSQLPKKLDLFEDRFDTLRDTVVAIYPAMQKVARP